MKFSPACGCHTDDEMLCEECCSCTERFAGFTDEELLALSGAIFAGSVESQISRAQFEAFNEELNAELDRRKIPR